MPSPRRLPITWRPVFLVAFCYIMFFFRLGAIGWLGPDEPRYAAVARTMYVTGDYVTPRLHGEPWLEKPVLLYWATALAYSALGVNETAARLPSALSATLCVLAVYFWGCQAGNSSRALAAGMILASSIGFLSFARAASTDMLLTACLSFALVAFLMGDRASGPTRRRWCYTAYACLGLATLAKGPVALILPALAVAGIVVSRGPSGEWRKWHPEGALVALAVALPWYVACLAVNGSEFVEVFIVKHNLLRFTSGFDHREPVWFYAPVLLGLSFPWLYLSVPALRRHLERGDDVLAWWALTPVVFFSLSRSKLPGYILPSIPPLALLLARDVWHPTPRAFRIGALVEVVVLALMIVGLIVYGDRMDIEIQAGSGLLAVVGMVFAGVVALLAWKRAAPLLAGLNAGVIGLVVVALTTFAFPRIDADYSMRPLADALPAFIPREQTVFLYKPARWEEYGLAFYWNDRIQTLAAPEELQGLTGAGSRILCIANVGDLGELSRISGVKLQIIKTVGHQAAFWAAS